MHVLVTGSRDWHDKEKLCTVLRTFTQGAKGKHTVIQGGCSGADKISARYAKRRDWTVITVPAEWKTYGKAAGPIRNGEMVKKHGPEVELFVVAIKGSKSWGTKNCYSKIRALKDKRKRGAITVIIRDV